MKPKTAAIRRHFHFYSYNNTEIGILIIETVVELIMAEDHNKNESESESEQYATRKYSDAQYIALLKRIERLEAEVESMQAGDNTGFKHENDGGYFD
jgi:hypothetical protein